MNYWIYWIYGTDLFDGKEFEFAIDGATQLIHKYKHTHTQIHKYIHIITIITHTRIHKSKQIIHT